jgi:hypothetical protein
MIHEVYDDDLDYDEYDEGCFEAGALMIHCLKAFACYELRYIQLSNDL